MTLDNQATIAQIRVEAIVYSIDPANGYAATAVSNWKNLVEGTSGYGLTVDALDTDKSYYVSVRVTDEAGNAGRYDESFTFGSAPLVDLDQIQRGFERMIGGYGVQGIVQGTTIVSADLSIPESMNVGLPPGMASGRITLSDIASDAGELVSANATGPFLFSIDGFEFRAESLTFSGASGLSFQEVTYRNSPIKNASNETRIFSYSSVALTQPPVVRIDSCSLSLETEPFSFTSRYRSSTTANDVDGLTLTGAAYHLFAPTSWKTPSVAVDTSTFAGIVLKSRAGADWNRSLPVDWMTFDSGLHCVDGKTMGVAEGSVILTMGGSDYSVTRYVARGNKITILEAFLPLTAGFATANGDTVLTLTNFSVCADGTVIEEQDFTVEDFTYTDASGYVYAPDPEANGTKFGFDGEKRLTLLQGVMTVPGVSGTSYSVSGLLIAGPDHAGVSVVGTYAATVLGFPISSTSARIYEDRIQMTTATVTTPSEFRVKDNIYILQGLALSKSATPAVVTAGTGDGVFSFSPAYGTPVTVTTAVLDGIGLFASQFSVVLPDALGGGTVEFTRMQLGSDGRLGMSAARTEAVAFTCGGFEATGSGASFNGRTVDFQNVQIALPDCAYPNLLDFTGMTVSGTAVTAAGQIKDTVGWNESGWSYSLSGVNCGSGGVTARATLYLPGEFGNRQIVFPEFVLHADGTSASGTATDCFYVRLFGWKTLCTGIRMQSGLLLADSGAVNLYSIMGGGTLTVPNIALDPGGGVVASGLGHGLDEFLSENGFLVESTSWSFAADGLRLGGQIHFPQGLGSDAAATYTAAEILLTADGNVHTQSKETVVSYSLGGWPVEAYGYFFETDGLTVRNSYLNANIGGFAVRLSFPALSFYPDGGIKAGGENLEGFTLPLFGGNVGVTRIGLTQDGVNLSGFITLPPDLGGASLYFDKLTLHPDGTVSTDVAVPEFGFNVEDFRFLFRNIRFDQGALSIGEAELTLPSDMDGEKIRLYDFSIDSDGSFQMGGLGFDPFQMWGYTFSIDSIGFATDIVSLQGSIRLPDDFVEGLAGKTIAIEDFRVTTAGEVLSFLVSLQGELEFNLGDSWTLTADTIGIRKDAASGTYLLTLDTGTLAFPPALGIEDVAITGVKINPITAAFTFDNVTISGVQAQAFGLEFSLDTLTISSDFDMTFAGSVKLPFDAGTPVPLRGKTIQVTEFQISHDGKIGNVAGSLGGIEGTLWNTLYLSNATIGFSRQTEDLLLSASGSVRFESVFPQGIAGKSLHLNAFTLNTSTWQVTAFDASSDALSFSLFGTTDVENAVIGLQLLPATGDLQASVSGQIALPAQLPPALAGRKVTIQAFTMSLEGGVSSFAASMALPGEQALFAGINLKDADLGASYEASGNSVVFSVGGSLVLSSSFPQGLTGTTATVDTLVFDSAGFLRDLSAQVAFPDQKLFGTLAVRGGTVSFQKSGASDMLVGVSGTVILPDSFPQGIAGLAVNINTFTIDSTGSIRQVDIATSNISAELFGTVALRNGAIHVSNRGNSEFLFGVTGDLVLPTSLPSGLSGLTLSVTRLDISSQSGLVAFNAGVASPVDFDVYAGIKASFTTVALSQSGFKLAGNVAFPQSFPQGLAGLVVSLADFQMSWGGEITAIAAGIGSAQITLAGFSASLTNLLFHPDGITLGSLFLTLPANMNGMTLGVANAGFDSIGKFYGSFLVPTIDIDIVGFRLSLVSPSIDVENSRISFTKAVAKLPDFIGGMSLTINGVKLGPSGLAFTGGAFTIPDFTIADGMGFKGLHVNFTLDGSSYFVEGGGSAFLPGVGTFETTVSFTNVSPAYPIGLKRAFFGYTVSGIGLPLGTTGLYLNGIRGGIAFGPPEEVPLPVQFLFPNPGQRLQLGLTMTDFTGGSAIQGNFDAWVDITNWTWAFHGNVAVLKGFFNSDLYASLNNRGFYGKVSVELRFVRGQIELWVADSKVAGSGNVQFGVPKGLILDYWFWCFGDQHVVVPWEDLLLPPVNAEFGRFSTGSEGFKGWVEVPVLGPSGIFVDRNGTITLGNVSQYALIKPFASSILASTAPSRSISGTRGDDAPQSVSGTPQSYNTIPGRVVRLDKLPVPPVKESFQVTVPGAAGNNDGLLIPDYRSVSPDPGAAAGSVSGRSASNESGRQVSVGKTARLVFVMGVALGNPQLEAISPSGIRYSAGEPNVEMQRTDWGYLMAVMDPEPGTWTVEVTGALSGDSYELRVLGMSETPQITLSTPEFGGIRIDTAYSVSGNAKANNGTAGIVTIYASGDHESFNGQVVGSAVPNAEGGFSASIDTSSLSDGEYYLYAGIRPDADSPEKRSYAPGTIVVNHQQQLAAILNFTAADNLQGSVEIHFTDPNGQRTSGYNLHAVNASTGTDTMTYLGLLTDLTMPGFEAGVTYRFHITPLDALGNEGTPCSPIPVTMGGEKLPINDFSISDVQVDPVLVICQIISATLFVQTVNPTTTGSAYDYLTAKVLEAPEGLGIGFEQQLWRIDEGGARIGCNLYARDTMTPGSYRVTIALANQGNPAQSHTVGIDVTVRYPTPTVNGIVPDGWHILDTPDLDIYGTSFFAGTRVFLDTAELTVKTIERDHIQAASTGGLTGGTHTIAVTGPGGNIVRTAVVLTAPSYRIVAHKSMATIPAGGTGACFFTILAENRFSGSVAFNIQDVPQDWNAQLDRQILSDGEMAAVTIRVPAGAAAGTSTIRVLSADGDVLPLDVTVSDAEAGPSISSLSAQTGFAGDPISIYGGGFGTTATALLGSIPMNVSDRGTDRLTVTVPEGVAQGDITVVKDGLVSNGIPFYVKSLNFTIYPDAKQLSMQPGESRDVNLYVAGFAKEVGLSASVADGSVNAVLSRSSIVPNGSLVLTVDLSAATPNGSYPVTIRGTSGNVTNTATVLVSVGSAFEITTGALAGAMEGVDYLSKVKTANGSEPVTVSMESGRLPYGLSLGQDGTIRGRPAEIGTSRFTLKAQDADGRSRTQALSISVTENAWSQDEKDGGRSRHNPVPSPADGRVQWTSASYADARAILTGHGRVFLLTADGVVGLDKETGRLLYRVSGNYRQWAYAGGTLFLLNGEGSFQALDGLTGNLSWSRSGASGFTMDGATIVLTTAAGAQVLDAATSTLEATITVAPGSGDILLWQNGVLLDVHENTLSRLVNGEWQQVYDGQNGNIVDAVCDATTVFLLTATGKLVMLDSEWAMTASVETGFTDGQIALGETRIETVSASGLKAYNRSDLSPLFATPISATKVAAAAEKVFAAGTEGLFAINGYDSTLIWKETGSFMDVALAGENAYALSAEGKVKRYNAPDNLYPPTTGIGLAPDSPDGDNGYYITTPTVSLAAHDLETYVQETWYRYGDLSYSLYQEPFRLPDGLIGLSVYSTDSKGYREVEETLNLRIDTVAPTTTLSVSGTLGLNGYYLTPVTLSLEASDAGSGVKESEYRIDGETARYGVPVVLGTEGSFRFSYCSRDIAGNWETAKEVTYLIDLYAPTAMAQTAQQPGLGIVYLAGSDTGSGLERLEYMLEGAAETVYVNPIVLTASGNHEVFYRAVDRAGRKSQWQRTALTVPAFSATDWIRDLRFAYTAKGRKVVTDVQAGQALYWPMEGRNNHIAQLPAYLEGSDFILTNVEDARYRGGAFLIFIAGTDCDVYVMKNKDSRADLTGWTLVESNYPVEPRQYFRGGADIYRLSVTMGTRVTVPGSAVHGEGGGNLVFVQKAAGASVWITSPMAGGVLAPLSKVRYAYALTSGQAAGQQWSVRYGNGAWTGIGSETDGEIELPYTDSELGMDLKLEVQLGGALVEKQAHYRIVNQAAITLVNPGPGTELMAGDAVALQYQAMGMGGETLSAKTVSWAESRDGRNWTPTATDKARTLTVPQSPGAYWLKATVRFGIISTEETTTPVTKEFLYPFTVVDSCHPVTIAMGEGEDGEEIADGTVVGPHASGKVYGFTPDHTGERGSCVAWYFDWPRGHGSVDRETEGFIRLLEGGRFEYHSGAGRYKVTVYAAPVEKRAQGTLTINGANYAISGTEHWLSMTKVEAETTAVDGKITIGGTERMPLMKVVIERLSAGAPAVTPSVTKVSNVVIYWDREWDGDRDGSQGRDDREDNRRDGHDGDEDGQHGR